MRTFGMFQPKLFYAQNCWSVFFFFSSIQSFFETSQVSAIGKCNCFGSVFKCCNDDCLFYFSFTIDAFLYDDFENIRIKSENVTESIRDMLIGSK